MRYTDKVLIELSKYILDSLYLGPKFTSRIIRGRSIRIYDVLTTLECFEKIPREFIFKKIDEKNYWLRLQGEKIFMTIIDKPIDEHLKIQPISVQSISLEVDNGDINTNYVIDPLDNKETIKGGYISFNNGINLMNHKESILRIVEYMAISKLKLEDSTKSMLKKHSYLVKEIDKSILKNIIFNILECKKSYYYFNYMDEKLNLLSKIIPEIDLMKEVGKCKYHVVDTWTHSIKTMKEIENIMYADGYFENHLKRAYELHSNTTIGENDRLKLLKLGALFHDIGKPKAKWTDANGRDHFRGHEIVGAGMVGEICERLAFSSEETEYLKKIVLNHMITLVLYKTNDVSANSLFGIFEKLGEDTMDIILIGLADIISTRRLLKPYEEMSIYKIHAEYLVNNYLIRYRKVLSLKEIINIDDIIFTLHCDREEAEEYMKDLRYALFNGEIYLDKDRILDYLKNRS